MIGQFHNRFGENCELNIYLMLLLKEHILNMGFGRPIERYRDWDARATLVESVVHFVQ